MCNKEGDVIFFNVDAPSLNYPVYYKDAFLNNNPDFDYGPFLNLEQMMPMLVPVLSKRKLPRWIHPLEFRLCFRLHT